MKSTVNLPAWVQIVREKMQKKGLKTKDLASLAGIPAPTLSTILSGNRKPSLRIVQQLVNALELNTQAELCEYFLALIDRKFESGMVLTPGYNTRLQVNKHLWIFESDPYSYFWTEAFSQKCLQALDLGFERFFFLTPGAAATFVNKINRVLPDWQKVIGEKRIGDNFRIYEVDDNFCRLRVMVENPYVQSAYIGCTAIYIGQENWGIFDSQDSQLGTYMRDVLIKVDCAIQRTPSKGMEFEGYKRLI